MVRSVVLLLHFCFVLLFVYRLIAFYKLLNDAEYGMRIVQIEERAIHRGRGRADVNDNSLRVPDLHNSF